MKDVHELKSKDVRSRTGRGGLACVFAHGHTREARDAVVNRLRTVYHAQFAAPAEEWWTIRAGRVDVASRGDVGSFPVTVAWVR